MAGHGNLQQRLVDGPRIGHVYHISAATGSRGRARIKRTGSKSKRQEGLGCLRGITLARIILKSYYLAGVVSVASGAEARQLRGEYDRTLAIGCCIGRRRHRSEEHTSELQSLM